ncbi:hypothetical protein N9H87_00770, partial [Pontimonas sp.]|nr:hypothetical protein [Pontimonas sp.]
MVCSPNRQALPIDGIDSVTLEKYPGLVPGCILAVVVGALLGSSFGFWLGRIFGPKLRGSWLGVRIGEDRWRKADRFVKKRGG